MKTAKPEIGMDVQMDARPHPGPLPQERENRRPLSRETTALGSVTRFAANEQGVAIATKPNEFSSDAAWLTLSPGERAGVRASVGLISLLLFSAALVHAQSYSIDWSTIAGGGGISTNATYALSGTIGQPDAGASMSGGGYSVQGGFWAGAYAVQIPEGPFLSITRAGANVIVSWSPATPGFVLQHSITLSSNNWQNAPSGVTNPIAIPAGSAARFYRLQWP